MKIETAVQLAIDPFSDVLSKLESQIVRNPDLPPAYKKILKNGFEARDRLIRAIDNLEEIK